jgi:excisionase family DNA binding protein
MVATELGVGHTTVEEWLKNREFEFFKKGRLIRIPREAFEGFVKRYTLKARGG